MLGVGNALGFYLGGGWGVGGLSCGVPGREARRGSRSLQANRLAATSSLPLELQTWRGDAAQSRALALAAEARTRTPIPVPPRNWVRAPWGMVAAPSRLPSARPPPLGGDPTPPPVRGRWEPRGGVAGAGASFGTRGAGGGVSGEAAPGRTARPPPPGSPHKGADGNATLTGQSGLRARASGRT